MRKSVSLFDSIVSPEFSMSSQGDMVMTRSGWASPAWSWRSTRAMAMLAPALSPTGVMSPGRMPSATSAL
jgi:hypothetical protein